MFCVASFRYSLAPFAPNYSNINFSASNFWWIGHAHIAEDDEAMCTRRTVSNFATIVDACECAYVGHERWCVLKVYFAPGIERVCLSVRKGHLGCCVGERVLFSNEARAKYLQCFACVVVRLDAESFPKPIRPIDIFAKLKAKEKPEHRAQIHLHTHT